MPTGSNAGDEDNTRPSLRERNRQRVRDDIIHAAMELFAHRNFDEITVDDIATAAGVSRRTFFRYFESKEEVVLPHDRDNFDRFQQVLTSQPPDVPIMDALRSALLAVADDIRDEQNTVRIVHRISTETPSVRARALEHLDAWESLTREIVAARLGVDPRTSLAPRLIAAVAVASARAAMETWAANDGAADLHELIGETFDLLTRDFRF